MFDVVRVDSTLSETLEPLGTKRKFWYREGSRRLLFKAEDRGTGEDWAEKVACELAGLLGLPHVRYDLAIEMRTEKPGVVCESCVVKPQFLALGNQILLALDPTYPAHDANKYKVKAHTVDAVCAALSLMKPPTPVWMQNVPTGIASSLDVFVGYVMLDAWIANQDRHHENWGVIMEDRRLFLAPTFDHGASMARNIGDAERQERMTSRDKNRQVESFAKRARSAFFDPDPLSKSMTTLEAWRGFAAKAMAASQIWLARLGSIEDSMISNVLVEVPPNRMSEVCRDFTHDLLAVNRRRLLTGES